MSDWTWTLPTGNAPGQAPPPTITMPPTTRPAGQPPTLPPVNRPSDPSLWVTPDTLPPPARDPSAPANGQPPAPGFLPNGQPDPNYRWGPQPPTTTPPGQPPGWNDVPQGSPRSPSTGAPMPTTGWQDPRSPTGRGYGWPGGRQSPFYGPNDPMMGLGPQLRMAGPAGGLVVGSESGGQNRYGQMTSSGQAEGYYQITTGTWNQFAPQAGVNLEQYPDPMHAPFDVQTRVAQIIPMSRWTAGWPAVRRQYPWATGDMTLGQVNQLAGGQGLASPEERGPDEWGRPYRGPGMGLPGMMPTPQQIPQIMQQNGLALLAVASSALHAPLWATLGAYGKFLQASNQRQILDQKLNQTKWQNALKEATAQQELEGQAYGDAFANPGNDPQQLDERLAEIASRFGDQAMLNALQQGGARAAYQLQQYRDQHGQMLGKANVTAAKDQFNEEMQIWRAQMETLTYQNQAARTQSEVAAQNSKIDAANAKAEQLNKQRQQLIEQGVPASEIGPPAPILPHVAAPAAGPGPPPMPAMPNIPNAPGTQTLPPPPWATGGDGAPGAPGSAPPGEAPSATAAPDPSTEATPPATETPPAATAGPDPSTVTPSPAAAPPAGGAQPPAPTAAAPAGAPPAPAQPPGRAPGAQPGQPGAAARPPPPKPIDSTIGYLLRGGDPSNLHGMDPREIAYAQQQAAAKRSGLDDVLYNSPDTGEKLVADIRKVDPGTAGQVQALLDRRASGGQAGFGNRISEWNQFLGQMARKADPSWNPNFDKAQQEWMNANGATQRLIGRANSMVRTGAQVLEYANKISNDPNALSRAWQQFQATGWAGSAAYTSLFQSWQSFVIDSNALKTGSAGGSVTETEEQARGIMASPRQLGSIPPSPEQIRDAVRLDTDIAQSKLQALQQQWNQSGTRTNNVVDPMYGLVPEVPADITAITHIDPATGRYPAGMVVPPALQGTVPPQAATTDDVNKALGQ